ncbi:hypothetical protein ACJX0J_028568, partial [Zea mays]
LLLIITEDRSIITKNINYIKIAYNIKVRHVQPLNIFVSFLNNTINKLLIFFDFINNKIEVAGEGGQAEEISIEPIFHCKAELKTKIHVMIYHE